jgi:hypothetical protein
MYKMRGILFVAITMVAFQLSCRDANNNAEDIINRTIEVHGGSLYENSIIEFDFRERHYKLLRNNGIFSYHRIFADSLGIYDDQLSNDGFQRTLDGVAVDLNEEWTARYTRSVNSVAYFALLPYGLNDPAVNKNLIGEEQINGNLYYKIRVTFDQEGGGEDYEDVFVYWINKDNFRMDYFGYRYETDGGGIRFREAVNVREVGGILFSDYINYKGADTDRNVSALAEKYRQNQLEKLSEIRLENLHVSRANDVQP